MSDIANKERLVYYRFDEKEDCIDPSRKFEVLFAVGREKFRGELRQALEGNYGPLGEQATNLLKQRMGIAHGTWTEAADTMADSRTLSECEIQLQDLLLEECTMSKLAKECFRPIYNTIFEGENAYLTEDIFFFTPRIYRASDRHRDLVMAALPSGREEFGRDRWRSTITLALVDYVWVYSQVQ